MANLGIGKEAPTLAYVGDKWNHKGTYNSKNENGYLFGQNAHIIRNYIMNHLDGQQGNLLKIMWLLLQTDEGFKVSQAWIIKSTGLSKQKYYDARRKLIDMNWLIYEEKNKEMFLCINYDFLWANALNEADER